MKKILLLALMILTPAIAVAQCTTDGINFQGGCAYPPAPIPSASPTNCDPLGPNVHPAGTLGALLYDAVEMDYHKKRESIAIGQIGYNSCKSRIFKYLPAISAYPDEVVISVTNPYAFPFRCTNEAWRYQTAARMYLAHVDSKITACLFTLSFFELWG